MEDGNWACLNRAKTCHLNTKWLPYYLFQCVVHRVALFIILYRDMFTIQVSSGKLSRSNIYFCIRCSLLNVYSYRVCNDYLTFFMSCTVCFLNGFIWADTDRNSNESFRSSLHVIVLLLLCFGFQWKVWLLTNVRLVNNLPFLFRDNFLWGAGFDIVVHFVYSRVQRSNTSVRFKRWNTTCLKYVSFK